MGWETLILMVILVSASGALFPGPIFISSVLQGLKQGAKAGLMIATGHMIVELALVLIIGAGISTILFYGQIALNLVTIIGSLALIIFGSMQVIGAIRSKNNDNITSNMSLGRNSLLIGLLFTSLNPHFITWWLTIGFKLVLDAFVLASWLGILVMFFSHVWMDYAWLTFVSYTARRGGEKILKRWIRPVVIVLSMSLIMLGIVMISQIL